VVSVFDCVNDLEELFTGTTFPTVWSSIFDRIFPKWLECESTWLQKLLLLMHYIKDTWSFQPNSLLMKFFSTSESSFFTKACFFEIHSPRARPELLVPEKLSV
jgi:uncharacterized membrane protein (UPF0182 family)